MGKVKFGLRDFQYAVLGEDDNVATKKGGIKKLPGMKSAKLDITNELVTVSADDGPYVVLSGGITETKLEIEVLDLTTDARKDFFGIKVAAGVEKYNKNLTPNNVACIFRTSDENGKAIWVGLLKGKFNLPGMETQTKEGSPNPKADTVTGNFVSRGTDGDVLVIGREESHEFNYEAFAGFVFAGATDIKKGENFEM
ncbi:TPA: phage tail protein, partial [Streptococcus equi subsp. equi]|uniref:major tail protein n=1 Tax=Streptococcus equi TaxID=1336 RepID=UPI0007CB8E3F|nr:major tail protein [Streptococcus equi]ASB97348.1 phage tail protein [Streptococcus equi subsp. equi]MBT1196871.1 phage tail protein [Streptococcus equi subsp. equi]MBT1199616.1 phage tail protein [Streptococcus equi subsp. equi]MBT1219945.1 phage tail protein [Streptococcus equi subsp. equi]MBT1221620.1 phage tail protein [Streptococcus equi subsp. equi]